MNLANRDLNLLVALQALLEEGNVTRAGDRLGVGQSAMSAALSRLRQHYQDELLIRVGRDLELTPLATQLLAEVQSTMPLLERALGIQDQFDPATARRRFTVLASDFAWLELGARLGALGAEAPGVAVDFQPLPRNPVAASADLLRADFVAALPGIGIDGESMPLFRDHYVCLLDADNPAVVDGTLSWQDFCALPHAMPGFGPFHHTPADRRLRELGFARVPAVQTHGFVPLPAVVEGTLLVAVVPSRLAARVVHTAHLAVVPAPFGEVEIVETLWWHPSKTSDAGHRWLRERLVAA